MPNVNSTTSTHSNPSIANNSKYDIILDESDTILNDLNDIIDSQINVKLKKRGEHSFKIKPITTATTMTTTSSMTNFNLNDLNKKTSDFELKMPKFKSYLIKSSLSSHINTLDNDSKANKNYGQHATTISGGKLITAKKSASKQGGKESVKSQASANDVSTVTASSTCVVNTSKKKRSSLFNLFSFKNLSRDSSISNSQTSIQNNNNQNSVTSLSTHSDKQTKMNEKCENKKFNEFNLVNDKQEEETIEDSYDYLDETTSGTSSFNYISSPPPPVEFSDEFLGEFPTTTTRFRPHSVSTVFNKSANGDQIARETKQHHVSVSPDWHKSFKFLLNSKKTSLSPPASTKLVQHQHAVAKPSLQRSKGGFSIPLNASYCVNTSKANFTPSSERRFCDSRCNNSSLASNSEILNCSSCCDDHNQTNPSFYTIKNKLKQEYLYQQQMKKLDMNIDKIYASKNFNTRNNLDTDLNESNYNFNQNKVRSDDNEYDESSILFPINSFDLKEANSCLKEVNLRLKYAQINSIGDDFSDETPLQQQPQTKLLNELNVDKKDTMSSQSTTSSLSSSSSLDSNSSSPKDKRSFFSNEQENEQHQIVEVNIFKHICI
jgi:hypothetical protein